jgi:hypothetical protein
VHFGWKSVKIFLARWCLGDYIDIFNSVSIIPFLFLLFSDPSDRRTNATLLVLPYRDLA